MEAPLAWDGLEDLRAELERRLERQCRDESELQDVLQETLIRAARYRAQLREVGLLVPWAMRIAMNVLRDLRRQHVRAGVRLGEDEEDALDSRVARTLPEDPLPYRMGRYEIETDEAAELLASVFPRLRPHDRKVLQAFYAAGERGEKAAELCGIPRRLVKVRVFRARQRLARVLRHRLALRHAQERTPRSVDPRAGGTGDPGGTGGTGGTHAADGGVSLRA